MRQIQEIPIIHVVALRFKMTDSIQGWCEKCNSAERELEDLKTEKECSLKNLHMLKAKVVATDLLIKDFAAKSRELEANVKKKKELSLLVEQINIECRNKTEELSIALRDREVLHKANEKLAEENMRCAERISKLENDMLAAKTLQDQYKERIKQVESEETTKNRSVEQLRKQLLAANKEAANAIKSAEELKKSLLEKKAEEKILQKKSASCKAHLLQFGRILKSNGLLTGKSLRTYERYIVPHDTNSASGCNDSDCDTDGDKLQQLLLTESGTDGKTDVETQTMTDTTSNKLIDSDLELELLLDMIPSMFIVPRNFRPLSPLPLSPKPCRKKLRKVPKNTSGHNLIPKENTLGNVTDISITESEPVRSEQVNGVRNAVSLEKDDTLTLDVVLEADIAVLEDRTMEDHQVAQNVPDNIEIDITTPRVDTPQEAVVITSPHKVAVVIDSPRKVTLITNTLVVHDAVLNSSSMEEPALPCIPPEIITNPDQVTPVTTDSNTNDISSKGETSSIISPEVSVSPCKLVMEVDISSLERLNETDNECNTHQTSTEVTVSSDAVTINSFTAVAPLSVENELPIYSPPKMAICPDQKVNADATTNTNTVFDPSNQETLRSISPKVIHPDQEVTEVVTVSNVVLDSPNNEIISPGNVHFDLKGNDVTVDPHVDPSSKECAVSPEEVVHSDKETAVTIDSNGEPDKSNKDQNLKDISPETVDGLDQEETGMVIDSNARPDDFNNNNSPKDVVHSGKETEIPNDSNGKPDNCNQDLDNPTNNSPKDVRFEKETEMVIDSNVIPDNSNNSSVLKDNSTKDVVPCGEDVIAVDINTPIPVSEMVDHPIEETMSEDFEPLMIVVSPSGHEEPVDSNPVCAVTVDPSSHSDQFKNTRNNITRSTPYSRPTLQKDTKAKPVSSEGHLERKKHSAVSFLKAGRVSKLKWPASIALSLCVPFTKLGNTVKEDRFPEILSHPGDRMTASDEVPLVKGRMKRSASREIRRKHKRPRILVTEHQSQKNMEIVSEKLTEEEVLRISPFHVPSLLSPLRITPPKLSSNQAEGGAERLAPKLSNAAPRRNLSVSLITPTANTTQVSDRLLARLNETPPQLNQKQQKTKKLKRPKLKTETPLSTDTKCSKTPGTRAKSSKMSDNLKQKQLPAPVEVKQKQIPAPPDVTLKRLPASPEVKQNLLPAPLEVNQKQLQIPARSDVDTWNEVFEDGSQEICEERNGCPMNSSVWCSQPENFYLTDSESDKSETEFGKQEAWKLVMRIKKMTAAGKDFVWAKMRSCFEEESFSGSVRQVARAAVAQLHSFKDKDSSIASNGNEVCHKELFSFTGREMKVLRLLDTLRDSRKGEEFHREMLRELWCTMMARGKRPVDMMVAACRTFVYLCRQKDDSQKVRVLCHDLLYNFPDTGIATVANALITWPEAFTTSGGGESPLRRVISWVLVNKNGPCELDTVRKTKVQDILGLVVQNLDQLTKQLLQFMGCGSSDGAVLLEAVQALQILAVHSGWQWTNDVLIREHLWTILQSWAQTNATTKPEDKVASNVIYLIGCLTRLCPLGDKSPAIEIIKTMKALLSQTSTTAVAECVQEAAVLVLLILKPFDEEMVTVALKEWWDKVPRCKSLSASTLRLLQSANIQ